MKSLCSGLSKFTVKQHAIGITIFINCLLITLYSLIKTNYKTNAEKLLVKNKNKK